MHAPGQRSKTFNFQAIMEKNTKKPKKHGLSDNAGFPPHVEAWEMSLGGESDGERKQREWKNVFFQGVNGLGVKLLHFQGASEGLKREKRAFADNAGVGGHLNV